MQTRGPKPTPTAYFSTEQLVIKDNMAAHFGFYGKWKESVESSFRCEEPVSPELSRLEKTGGEPLR